MGSLSSSGVFRWLLIGGVVVLAGCLRIPKLSDRPMHADEAILADKFGTLLEHGTYKYDPTGYHGPALPYATLLSARLAAVATYGELNETTLRMVPVVAGMALVTLPLLLIGELGWHEAAWIAALTAISPALVFYSRYYIPEALLVCFTFGVVAFGYRYARNPSGIWIVLAGACAGLAYSTKETWIIAFASLFVALFAAVPFGAVKDALRFRHSLAGLGAFACVVAVLYSPSGIVDSFRALPLTYLPQAFQDEAHIHPWYFYWQRWLPGGAFLALLAIVSAVRARSPLVRFLSWNALLLALCYTAIPYKTPWSFLGAIHAIILLAGIGAADILRQRQRALVAVLLTAGCLHLAWQAYRTSDSGSPWAYARTTTDVYRIRGSLHGVAETHPAGFDMRVQVVSTDNVWPLPWYLRPFSQVEWWTGVSPEMSPAPVILATPDVEEALVRQIYEKPPGEKELYVPLFEDILELRPGLEIRGYIAKSLWDRHREIKP